MDGRSNRRLNHGLAMAAPDTKERLLDSAEAAFAEQGFAGASLRGITRRAGANLAAVHYHFGSKEALFGAVFERRFEAINRERLRRLDELERRAGGRPVALEALVRAFVEPACSVMADDEQGARFLRLSGRMFSEPGDHWMPVRRFMEPIRERFVAAFAASLPGLAPASVYWRLHFVLGAMCHALAAGPLLTLFSDGACDGDDRGHMLDELVPFLTAGMRAPRTAPVEGIR
jgi:AcrR family transcriptional regulator